MIWLLTSAALLAGIAIGNAIWHRKDYLLSVAGPIPAYAVHREAELVAHRLIAFVTTEADKAAIDRAARRVRVWTSADGFNPGAPSSRYGRVAEALTADNGKRVYVQGGDGWEQRFAGVMAHALHGLVRGDEDPERKDQRWFDAALAPWLSPVQKGQG